MTCGWGETYDYRLLAYHKQVTSITQQSQIDIYGVGESNGWVWQMDDVR